MWEPGDLWVHNLFIQVPMGLPTPTPPPWRLPLPDPLVATDKILGSFFLYITKVPCALL